MCTFIDLLLFSFEMFLNYSRFCCIRPPPGVISRLRFLVFWVRFFSEHRKGREPLELCWAVCWLCVIEITKEWSLLLWSCCCRTPLSFLSKAKLGRQKKLKRAHSSHFVDEDTFECFHYSHWEITCMQLIRNLGLLMHLKALWSGRVQDRSCRAAVCQRRSLTCYLF